MNPAPSVTESRIHKKFINFSHSIKVFGGGGGGVCVWGGGGRGGEHSTFTSYLMKLWIGYSSA